jgi:hypothetical protein
VPEPHSAVLGDYEITTDKQRLDLDRVEALLTRLILGCQSPTRRH